MEKVEKWNEYENIWINKAGASFYTRPSPGGGEKQYAKWMEWEIKRKCWRDGGVGGRGGGDELKEGNVEERRRERETKKKKKER